MTTLMTESPTASEGGSATTSRRSRSSRRSETGATSATPRRSRRARLAGDALVASLAEMIDQLIKENRDLKRAIERAERARGSASLGQAVKTLSGLQRRLDRVLDGASSGRRRRTATVAAAPRPRRKVTDPEVLERRRQALAKARAVRQAKRQAAAAG